MNAKFSCLITLAYTVTSARSIRHLERRTVLGPTLAVIVEAGSRDVRVAEPVLHLGNVGAIVERIGGGGRAQRMGTGFEAERPRIFLHQFVDRIRRKRLLEGFGHIVFDRPEERAVVVHAVAGRLEVIVDQRVGAGMELHIARLVAFAGDLQIEYPRRMFLESLTLSLHNSSRRNPWNSSVDRIARSRLLLSVSLLVAASN